MGSELQIEVAEFLWRDVQVSYRGSINDLFLAFLVLAH